MTEERDPSNGEKSPPPSETPCNLTRLRNVAEPKAKQVELYEIETLPPEEVRRILHELRVHQVELTMQNEELQKTQERLEASRARYVELYDLAPMGYCTISHEGLILEANLTLTRLLGRGRKELINKMFSRFIVKQDQDYYYRKLLYESGSPQAWELRMQRNGGDPIWVRLEGTCSRDEKNSLTCRVAVSDVTARKKVEEELTRYRANLEELVKERTAELESANSRLASEIRVREAIEEDLRKSRDELELRVKERTSELRSTTNSLETEVQERKRLETELRQAQKMEALGTLTGGIAHDFNNILAGIIGFTEMTLDDLSSDSPARRYLELVLKGSFRGRDLIKQLLSFSRKDAYEITALRLTPIIEETVKLLRASIPATISIKLKIATTSDNILANATGIQQIIMNLATNAAHAMKTDGGTLSIALSDARPVRGLDLKAGNYLELSVRDTGVGMEQAVLERIFEPFFTTKEVGQGTGMGLAVVYGIVKSLQGYISVESTPGKGTAFHILLPRANTEESYEPVASGAVPTGHETVLFVDDEEMLAELGKEMLEKLGYTVTAFTNSADALKLVLEDPSKFDLVITDLSMPGLAGLHLAKELLAARPGLPIILCTGHADDIDSESAKRAGIREFLMKPLAKRELAEAVRRTLDHKP
ncbi:MAG TPA: response regulator [Syntrophorhabdaceae bacterium]|nr:response regulator [Syntrophorhabdaceae bacterium]